MPSKTARPASPKSFVEMTVRFTPEQAEVIRYAARELRSNPEDFIAAASLSETQSWCSYGEFLEGMIPELVRFIDERAVPKPQF